MKPKFSGQGSVCPGASYNPKWDMGVSDGISWGGEGQLGDSPDATLELVAPSLTPTSTQGSDITMTAQLIIIGTRRASSDDDHAT